MLSLFCLFWLEMGQCLSIRNIGPKCEIWLKFYLNYRHIMTNWLWLFLAFYILVGQPAILGRMLDNCSLYELAWLNAGIFIIAWIISAMCKSPKKQTKAESITSQLLWENAEGNSGSWVAVVKVQETTVKEIEVAKVDIKENLPQPEATPEENIQSNIAENNIHENIAEENREEVKEKVKEEIEWEKSEEKFPERPMRETVSIPKIVQPLSWHQVPKKRRREIKWGQRLVLLLTLGIAAVIAWTLWEFLWNRWIGISLFLWRILYLVIGKLFDINGFYNAKKLFTNWLYIILIIAWFGYGVYATQDDASLKLIKDKAVSYVQNRFKSEKEDVEISNVDGEWDEIYVFEWKGEVITDIEDNTDILDETGVVENEIENVEVDTWIVENIEPEVEVQPEPIVESQTPSMSEEEAKKQITMWEAIKSLVGWATLSTKTNVSFKYVSKSNELYPYFKTAQERWMIWTDTDPSKLVSCDTYITMKWIREWREVGSYTKSNVKAVYWDKAAELWKLNGCEKWKYVTKWNL